LKEGAADINRKKKKLLKLSTRSKVFIDTFC